MHGNTFGTISSRHVNLHPQEITFGNRFISRTLIIIPDFVVYKIINLGLFLSFQGVFSSLHLVTISWPPALEEEKVR